MNNWQGIGRLTKDVELRYSGEKPIAHFTIAVDGYKEPDFIPIVAFERQAENCNTYLKKGSLVGVTGEIKTGSYEKDGKKIYTWNINAKRVEFLSPKEKPEADIFEPVNEDIPF